MSTNHVFALLFYILNQERERGGDFELWLGSAFFLLWGGGGERGLRLIFPNSPQIFSF